MNPLLAERDKRYYGLLSNSYTSALVSPDGSVDWLPFPRFDSPAVLASLLDARRGGHFSVRPGTGNVTDRRYLPDSNVLATLWSTPDGPVRTLDYLSVGTTELRRVIHTEAPVLADLDPVFQYGQIAPAFSLGPHGGLFQRPGSSESLLFRIRGSGTVERAGESAYRLGPGRHELLLRYTTDPTYDQALLDRQEIAGSESPEAQLRREVQYWRSFPRPRYEGPYLPHLMRALLVIRGLTFRPTGALVAAATTSLPEIPGDARQWDYRYVWVRDGAYAAEALVLAGDYLSARRFLEFVFNTVQLADRPLARPFTQVDGSPVVGEEELLWLSGHAQSRPVRTGNAATGQVQLDIEGDFVWALWLYVEATGDTAFLHQYARPFMAIVDWTAAHWNIPDASLWEFRGQDRHYTHSKLMAWVALSRGSELARRLGRPQRARVWAEEANRLRATIEEMAFDVVTGRFGQSFGSPDPDASLLLLPLYGFLDPHDPRFDTTLAAVEEELRQGPYLLRYRRDMLGQARHPFLLTSFWLMRVLARRGETERAREILDGVLADATDLGLMAEHVDPALGVPRGNFPQLFSHVGLATALLEMDHPLPAPGTQPA